MDLGLLFHVKWGCPISKGSLIIGPTGWDVTPIYRKLWAGIHLMGSDLTLGTSIKVKFGFECLNVPISQLLCFRGLVYETKI